MFDMVFIDTWHVRAQMKRELEKFSPFCAKYIVMHDTTVDEFVGESVRAGWNVQQQSSMTGFSIKEICEGIWPAISDFLESNKDWVLHERYYNNNGLTILRRRSPVEDIVNEMKNCGCEDVVICTYGDDKVFLEVTRTLQQQLIDMDVSCRIEAKVAEESLSAKTFYLLFNSHNCTDTFPFNIKYAVFNYEQAGSPYILRQQYLTLMCLGVCVFDYSHYNAEYLRSKINKRVVVVPYSYHSSLTVLSHDVTDTEEYDVMFYGFMNDNRKKYASLLESSNLKVKWHTNYSIFGDQLIEEMKKAKIILNIHYYDNPSVLEITRIIPAVSNYKLVLSERSTDTKADERFKDIIVFIDENTVVSECKKYVENPQLRHQRISEAFERFKNL
jgi:hypothetical protein